MGLFLELSALALRQSVGAATHLVGLSASDGAADAISHFFTDRFTNHSRKLTVALERSHRKAWQAVEISLAGDSFWRRCASVFGRSDYKAFREQVREFLDSIPPDQVSGSLAADQSFRDECLKELRAARKAGVLDKNGAAIDAKALAERVARLAQFNDPQSQLKEDRLATERLADTLPAGEYANLSRLLRLRIDGGDQPPLLLVAVRYFFRREVEGDQELFQGLAFDQLGRLEESQDKGFAALGGALDEHGKKFDEALDEVLSAVVETREAVLDLGVEQERQGEQLQDLYDAVLKMKERLDLSAVQVRPRDSLSIRSDAERLAVRSLLDRFRALPAESRREAPALLNGLGMLGVAAGDFDEAERVFNEVAETVSEPTAEAEAHYNAYRAALERRDWAAAVASLRKAVALDAARFEPFPFEKYEPQAILGAGGFGVTFLCRHRQIGSLVAVKSLTASDQQRDVDAVFGEAQALDALRHPAIVRVRDCDFAGDGKQRPYLVMDYVDGMNLEEHVRREGVLSPGDALPLMRELAEALSAAHERGILHRDIKPSNLLVKRPSAGGSLEVTLIDFGLALQRTTATRDPSHGSRSLIGSSIAGTAEYAAPEQMGRLEGVPTGTYSDVYGFGKTFCFAMFKTANPLMRHWKTLPNATAELLNACLAEDPKERPADFKVVLERLGSGGADRPQASHPPPLPGSGSVVPPPPPPPPRRIEGPRLVQVAPDRFLFRGPHGEAVQLVGAAILRAGFKPGGYDAATGVVTAASGLSWASWGENLSIAVRPISPEQIEISLRSELKIGYIDWGRNQRNVAALAAALAALAC